MRKSLMTPTRERNPVQIGVIGLVLAVATVGAALQYDQLQFINGGIRYSAYFQDAGGLVTGDDVTMAGVKVGKVSDVEFDRDLLGRLGTQVRRQGAYRRCSGRVGDRSVHR